MSELSPEISWFVLGMLLLGGELLSGTFVLMFFSGSALVISLLVWMGLLTSVTWQLVGFGLLSLAALFMFKDKVKAALQGKSVNSYKGDFGETVVVEVDIPAGGHAVAKYQGSEWTIVNSTNRMLCAGETVKIQRVEGVKLMVS
jgi:membrane protein implicated in regulation of membrane protease activity